MSASPAGSALYCVFHNDYMFESRKTGQFCSHIFAAVVRPGKGGYVMDGVDYDGSSHSIATDLSRKTFNLAATVPVPAENARRLSAVVNRINTMSDNTVWPFYFSVDMAIKPYREMRGQPAIAPEGHEDPPRRQQNSDQYGQGDGSGLTLARINCVRMSMLTAGLAGIDVAKIADINLLSNTGEEVRDSIRQAAARCKGGRRDAGLRGTQTLFGQKDRDEGQVTGMASGLSVIESETPVTLTKFLSALSRKTEGRTLFDWMTKGKAQDFATASALPPLYLQQAFAYADALADTEPDTPAASVVHAASVGFVPAYKAA